MNLLLSNLKITLMGTLSLAKVTSFLYWQKHWIAIIDYVTKADLAQRKSFDSKKINVIYKYTRNCRIKTYFYWSLIFTTIVVLLLTPLLKYTISSSYRANISNGTEKYVEIVSLWVPFDKSTLIGYLGASVIQLYVSVYGGGWLMSFDTTTMAIMVFFRGELEMLRIDSSKIFGDVSDHVSFNRLKDCHRRHAEMIEYAKLFDSCLSPIMFQYMLVFSVILCVTAYEITIATSTGQQLLVTVYLVFIIAQLFIYCWHSNENLCASQDLMLGPYKSSWWKIDVKRRKDLYTLTEQFKTVVIFSAGPFSKLSISTFINILKVAGSYYALLSYLGTRTN